MPVFRSRHLALLTCLLVAATVRAEPPDNACEPIWSWLLRPGIEWATLVGEPRAPALLVATRDARLQLLDLATGQARWTETIPVGRGVRPAGNNPPDVAYCFDRHAVYALNTSGPTGLIWRHGEPPPNPDRFQGDPEVLSGWVAVAATPAGPVAVNTDGRVILLSADTGVVRRTFDLGQLPVARLHVDGLRAIVLWQASGSVKAAFLNLEDQRSRPAVRAIGTTWPLWSCLIGDRLLTVSPTEVAQWSQHGPPLSWDIQAAEMRAAMVDVLRPSGDHRTPTTSSACPPALIILGDGPRLAAYDLATGRRHWPAEDVPDAGMDALTLAVDGCRLLVTYPAGAIVCDARTGAVLGACPLLQQPAELVSAGLAGDCLYTLDRDPRDPRHPLRLARLVLKKPGSDSPDLLSRLPTLLRLPPVGDIQRVIWTNERMVVVAQSGLQAYKLP